MSEYLRGRVLRILHKSETFHILSFSVFEAEGRFVRETKITGHFFGVDLIPDAVLEIDGNWHRHPRYGVQFKAIGWLPWARHAPDVSFFLRHCVKIFDADKTLTKAVNTYGAGTYDALMDRSILKMADNEADEEELVLASNRWQALREIAILSDFLQECDLAASLAASIFQRFGMESVKVVSKNPYRLMEIDGMSFLQVNKLGVRQNISPGDPRRVVGGVLWAIRDQVRQGHLFVRRGDLPSIMQRLANYAAVASFNVPDLPKAVASAIEALEKSNSLKVDPDVGVYLPDMFKYEREAADILSRFVTPSELDVDVDPFLKSYESDNNIELSKEQREAVAQLVNNRVLVVSGAPGTGKTTLVRTFVRLFQQLQISYMLMAPTGIAAKRLASVTESGAQTIHRALRYDGISWGRDSNEPLEAQAIIVDEFSMVDQELFYRLLDALEPGTMLVMVGDDAQLPSVGAGNVLRELLACSAVPHVRLSHVFRQAETSDIVLAAHRVRRGESPLGLPAKDNSEFRFLQSSDDQLVLDMVVKMARKLKDRDANFQVLSPKYEGTVGVDRLNEQLRDELNPDHGQPRWKLPSFETRVGDRLMVIKNNYHLNVYNGDIAKLIDITKENLTLRIHGVGMMPDTNVDIPKGQAGAMLKLAYAVTVHRCQGEEFETVIMPLMRSQGRMLQRNLFYTAITRARTKVWLLGEQDAVLRAVANDKVVKRNTVLRHLVKVRRAQSTVSQLPLQAADEAVRPVALPEATEGR